MTITCIGMMHWVFNDCTCVCMHAGECKHTPHDAPPMHPHAWKLCQCNMSLWEPCASNLDRDDQTALFMPSTIQETNPYLQRQAQWVNAVEVCLTNQRGQYLWWYIFNHPIAQEIQYAWEVLGVPAQGGRGGADEMLTAQDMVACKFYLSRKIEPSACASILKRPLNTESSRQSGYVVKTF